jgi:nucleotide-binding universal stress UspA family protein
MRAPKTILVATDFSDAAEAALDHAVVLAAKLGAKVVLLHAYELPMVGYPDGMLVPNHEMTLRIVGWAEKELAECVAARRDADVPIELLLRQSDPREAILSVAKERDADLIVVGTHGRRGIVRALLGSIAESVVRTSPVPVLTVHAPA